MWGDDSHAGCGESTRPSPLGRPGVAGASDSLELCAGPVGHARELCRGTKRSVGKFVAAGTAQRGLDSSSVAGQSKEGARGVGGGEFRRGYRGLNLVDSISDRRCENGVEEYSLWPASAESEDIRAGRSVGTMPD